MADSTRDMGASMAPPRREAARERTTVRFGMGD